MVLEPTSKALWGRYAGCLSGVGTYLLDTVGQGCRLFKQCWNLPPGHCWAGVKAVKMAGEPTSQAMWGSFAGCLSGVGTYLLSTVEQGCRLFQWCQILTPG